MLIMCYLYLVCSSVLSFTHQSLMRYTDVRASSYHWYTNMFVATINYQLYLPIIFP